MAQTTNPPKVNQGDAGAAAWPVDGSAVTQPVSAASLPLPSGAATGAKQDTGNTSLGTVAGAVAGTEMQVDVVAALPAGTNNIGDVDVLTLPALVAGTANIGDVDIASIAAGDNNIGNVDIVTAPTLTVQGGAANAAPVAGNPNLVAGRASTAIPTDVGADGDAASMWTNRNGAQMVSSAPHIGLNGDPWSLVSKTAQYTAAQTSTVLVAGGVSEKIVVTKLQIQVYGTTAGTAIVYFGTAAYSRGTSLAIFDGEFAPSATLKPGVVDSGPWIAGTNGDDIMVTTTNALSITITVWYYVVV